MPALRYEDYRGYQGGEDDRHVQQEDRAPPVPAEQPAAHDRTQRDPDACDAGPGPDCLDPFLAGKDVDENRQGGRHDHGAADPHQRPRDDQLRRRASVRAEHTRRGEHHKAEQQEPLAAEPVAERSHREQEPGEHQDVGIDDPLQRRRGRAELPLQRRHRNVDDGVVNDDDQQAQ